MKRFVFLLSAICLAASTALFGADDSLRLPQFPLTEPTAHQLPRWSGFNLLEKLNGRNFAYLEDDFRMIAYFGFNFVRLPMDYRAWSGKEEDWTRFDEKALKDIDQAIAFGIKYNVHVCLNFHRAPGYQEVNKPKFALFYDDKALEACAHHWAVFARRYKGIPGKNLSFNLLNEPPPISKEGQPVTSENYRRVIERIVKAVRAEDPNRPIIVDGENGAFNIPRALEGLGVAVAAHGYLPHRSFTHHGADFTGVDYSGIAVPVWADNRNHLNGIFRRNMQPFEIEFKPAASAPVAISAEVGSVYDRGQLIVCADGREIGRVQLGRDSDKSLPAWQKERPIAGTRISEYVYNRAIELGEIPEGTSKIILSGEIGQLTVNRFKFAWKDKAGQPHEATLEMRNLDGPLYEGNQMPRFMRCAVFDTQSGTFDFSGSPDGFGFLRDYIFGSWEAYSKTGVPVLIGEFGYCNTVPRQAALEWMRDSLEIFRQNKWPWALWQFRGVWGVLDTQTEGVSYIDFEGHRLDREKLRLLQSYR